MDIELASNIERVDGAVDAPKARKRHLRHEASVRGRCRVVPAIGRRKGR